MQTYTIAHLGCGGRGRDHIRALVTAAARLRLVGLCDQKPERLSEGKAMVGKDIATYADAEQMLGERRPDVFSFCTPPAIRQPLIELALRHGVRLIVCEKPMALSLAEARELVDLTERAGVPLIISHQHKYGGHWRAVKSLIDAGELGEVKTIHVTSKGWMAHYATHLIDYAMWLAGEQRPKWAVGHAHGVDQHDPTHPSPEYLMGQLELEGGVRVLVECGLKAPDQPPYDHPETGSGPFWMDAGATVVGTQGVGRVVVGHGWSAVTAKSGAVGSDAHRFDGTADTADLYREVADCLDDPWRRHSCRAEQALRGYEAMAAICASAADRRLVNLPFEDEAAAAAADAAIRCVVSPSR